MQHCLLQGWRDCVMCTAHIIEPMITAVASCTTIMSCNKESGKLPAVFAIVTIYMQ